ncbi:hypothetical protein BV22DRAFT_1051005 [Leucogyrophana mollusca]|uniref:Uncharacterized protein n=1 Tax=Leucogyrophana mollusca TaxID=85980 RepID=A0ACB8B1T4_9AGAM|nr:hypothetical protein BV22DRAFT_1051005 [Leucogyrophana mollusca]
MTSLEPVLETMSPKQPLSPFTSSTSTGSLKRALTPEPAPTHNSQIPVRKDNQRPTKRPKATPAPQTQHELTKPIVFKPVILQQPTPPQLPPPSYSGNFDLYGMYLPFLTKFYLPAGATYPDYAALYEAVLAHQAKHDFTARCYLGAPTSSTSTTDLVPSVGRFESQVVIDPMIERPFDMNIGPFTYKKNLTFTPTERSSFLAAEHNPAGPGMVAQTGLPSQCGIKSAKGVFKIKRVWVAPGEGVAGPKELFEGFFSFSVSYDSMYRKAGHGTGAKYKFAFWGVRAMRDNSGKEIGLGVRKALW